jgi:hypothetical protein
MSEQSKRIFFGVLLVLVGALFLLQQIFSIPFGGLFIGLLFALGGAVFLYFLVKDRNKWWAAIPGFVLLGLGALITSSSVFPEFGNRFGGSLFLAFIGLGFLVVYLLRTEQWWPIIPAGVLFTLAVVAGIRGGGDLAGAIFFLGVGATFVALGIHPIGKKEKWPWIPAGICFALGVLILALSGALVGTFAGWVWALLLILAGGFLVVRSLMRKE